MIDPTHLESVIRDRHARAHHDAWLDSLASDSPGTVVLVTSRIAKWVRGNDVPRTHPAPKHDTHKR